MTIITAAHNRRAQLDVTNEDDYISIDLDGSDATGTVEIRPDVAGLSLSCDLISTLVPIVRLSTRYAANGQDEEGQPSVVLEIYDPHTTSGRPLLEVCLYYNQAAKVFTEGVLRELRHQDAPIMPNQFITWGKGVTGE